METPKKSPDEVIITPNRSDYNVTTSTMRNCEDGIIVTKGSLEHGIFKNNTSFNVSSKKSVPR